MDFSITYTPEQEAFRKEVRAWLEANAPKLEALSGASRATLLDIGRQFRRALGEKGWLAPIYPPEYGGGGLSEEHAIVLQEELAPWDIPELGGLGLSFVAPALLEYGTEEQKARLLPPILRGEVTVLQLFSEPRAGSDLSSLETRAVRDGDEYVLSGEKVFKEQFSDFDYLYTLAVTDPDGPPRENLTAFLVPVTSSGITVHFRRLTSYSPEERVLVLDNVRVPLEYVLGQENQGWYLAQASLELERGGMGSIGVSRGRPSLLDQIIGLSRQGTRMPGL